VIRELLHDPHPYEGIVAGEVNISGWAPGETNLAGWGSEDPIFGALFEEFRPRLVVELGTWLGGSAITMAKVSKALGLECEIVCVDTFLGDAEPPPPTIPWKNGRPCFYEQFLVNVVATGHEDAISPFPQTTANAARWFENHHIKPDLVYVDASHEEIDVQNDLRQWAPLALHGMFGHDYSDSYPGVAVAVHSAFGDEVDLSRIPFWIYRRAA
jgi:hypothetical protein